LHPLKPFRSEIEQALRNGTQTCLQRLLPSKLMRSTMNIITRSTENLTRPKLSLIQSAQVLDAPRERSFQASQNQLFTKLVNHLILILRILLSIWVMLRQNMANGIFLRSH